MIASLVALAALGYPTDPAASDRTQIRRLAWQRDLDEGKRKGRKMPPGGRWPMDKIVLKMTGPGAREFDLTAQTPKDLALQQGLEQILRRNDFRRYNVAILVISDPLNPRFAGVGENDAQTPGSVAKLVVAGAMYRALRERFPNDTAAREELLKATSVSADEWLMKNGHEVPHVHGDKVEIRAIKVGDTFTLWEWIDHALSPSSNAAGTLVWREAILMNLLGAEYPAAKRDAKLWARWDRDTFTKAAFEAVDKPLIEAGLDPETFRLRAFFTKGAGRYIRSASSGATPLGLLQWMVRVEQGRMIDEFSSLDLKRMLYLTRRRVRYARNPVLSDAAIFFKSGSYYECKPEPGYTCIQYLGNVTNVLNALVEVETPNGEGGQHNYLVAVMSNELKKNAHEEHGRLAGEIHQLITGR